MKGTDCRWRRDMYCAIERYSEGSFVRRFCDGRCPDYEDKEEQQ